MGVSTAVEMDAWLQKGGLVVTASERTARALTAEFHRARRAEGLGAWPVPRILDWKSFVRVAWEQEETTTAPLLLNPAQEQSLWAEIAGQNHSPAMLLEEPRHRLAAMAMRAHELLCSYAPRFLDRAARTGWQQDAAAFSRWLAAFDEACRDGHLLSSSRLPWNLIPLLKSEAADRPPLLITGFDRILPVERALFDAWGVWREATRGEPATDVHFYAAADTQTELTACARWCGQHLAHDPGARLMVVTQTAGARRGAMERAFLAHAGPASAFEFTLGVPLGQVALARAAFLTLRWLSEPLAEQELDWLFSTGFLASDARESAALSSYMRALRRSGLERMQWTLTAFLAERRATEFLPAPWMARIGRVFSRVAVQARQPQSPLDWAEWATHLLDDLHFAAARPLASAEYQAAQRWRQAVEACASLGFDGRRIGWEDFLAQLGRALNETVFAPESRDASIQIVGPAESAGLSADAVWFLGADEDSWPAGGALHPFVPAAVQREAEMPHATARMDLDLARAITQRLLGSASEVCFSYARQIQSSETRPSRLIVQFAGEALDLSPELAAPVVADPQTEPYEDPSRIPFPAGRAEGGSHVLTAQSQCPFQAFASVRLGAEGWRPAETGLTAAQRGSLLHAVLHAIWSGPPEGIRSFSELKNLPDREAFVAGHVRRVFTRKLYPHLRETMPRRYLEIEERRLNRVVSDWLEFETTRIPFDVSKTEVKRTVRIAGLVLNLRLDRVDRLCDGSSLILDYKTGRAGPDEWELPRPNDVQLPLYACFALDSEERLGGLVFAKVRPGEMKFSGRVGDAAATLLAGLKGANPLLKSPLEAEQLLDWRESIEQLARDFLAGYAAVDPRDAPATCARCGLQTLCRIQERPVGTWAEAETFEEDEDGNDA
ncbi:MAG: PD-(D/E)XK nuclease family protein [Terracidiphilus sp.]